MNSERVKMRIIGKVAKGILKRLPIAMEIYGLEDSKEQGLHLASDIGSEISREGSVDRLRLSVQIDDLVSKAYMRGLQFFITDITSDLMFYDSFRNFSSGNYKEGLIELVGGLAFREFLYRQVRITPTSKRSH